MHFVFVSPSIQCFALLRTGLDTPPTAAPIRQAQDRLGTNGVKNFVPFVVSDAEHRIEPYELI